MAKQQAETATANLQRRPELAAGGAAEGTTKTSAPSAVSILAAAVFFVLLAAATLPGAADAYVLRGRICQYGYEIDAYGRQVRRLQGYTQTRDISKRLFESLLLAPLGSL